MDNFYRLIYLKFLLLNNLYGVKYDELMKLGTKISNSLLFCTMKE